MTSTLLRITLEQLPVMHLSVHILLFQIIFFVFFLKVMLLKAFLQADSKANLSKSKGFILDLPSYISTQSHREKIHSQRGRVANLSTSRIYTKLHWSNRPNVCEFSISGSSPLFESLCVIWTSTAHIILIKRKRGGDEVTFKRASGRHWDNKWLLLMLAFLSKCGMWCFAHFTILLYISLKGP